jgi:hypothetical protein
VQLSCSITWLLEHNVFKHGIALEYVSDALKVDREPQNIKAKHTPFSQHQLSTF